MTAIPRSPPQGKSFTMGRNPGALAHPLRCGGQPDLSSPQGDLGHTQSRQVSWRRDRPGKLIPATQSSG